MTPNNTATMADTDEGIIIIDADSDTDSLLERNIHANHNMHDSEREVWEFMTPMAWHKSIADKDSIFRPTYQATIDTLRKAAEEGGYDVIVEVGCGTGDIIGEMNQQKVVRTSITNLKDLLKTNGNGNANNAAEQMVTIPCIGVDINKEFIDFCKSQHPHESCTFVVADALKLEEWWKEEGHDKRYSKPLIICVNNTLNIMPHELRGGVVDQMIAVAGKDGLCMVSYWNGNFFSHAVMNYYKKNAPLCGAFDVHEHVDWDKRILVTPSDYATHWQSPLEVQQLLRGYDVDVSTIVKSTDLSHTNKSHIRAEALAIFVWFDYSNTSNAKGYYDSDDAQKFYTQIWGEDELHVGRYDLLTPYEKSTLSPQHQIRRAEEYHELELINHIRCCCLPPKDNGAAGDYDVSQHTLRVVDMGCGYGGMMRRLHREGLVWKATGCDISHRMCAQARKRNDELMSGSDNTTLQILEQSYLQIGVDDESVDVVISMDALLHVGPERQRVAIKEAYRILRPGGWMIFSDIMQNEIVDAKEMQPIYDRINLSKMGTVSNYKDVMESSGFSNFFSDLHSENIATHYGHVLEVTESKGAEIGLSDAYLKKAKAGLTVWKENSPGNITWGIMAAQKTHKVEQQS